MIFNTSLTINKKGGGTMSGVDLFLKYALPPNYLGYCGPRNKDLLFELYMEIKEKREKAGEVKLKLLQELRELSSQFSAAVPYLKIIAASNGINDFFDSNVVEAYWIGNDLLNNVKFNVLYKDLKERYPNVFIVCDDRQMIKLTKEVQQRIKPFHTLHVLSIYAQKEFTLENYCLILKAIDDCRIRHGEVVYIYADNNLKDFPIIVDVSYSFLEMDKFGNLILEKETTGKFFTLDENIKTGDIVSLHYNYVCEKLTHVQKYNLEKWTNHHIEIFNAYRDNIMF